MHHHLDLGYSAVINRVCLYNDLKMIIWNNNLNTEPLKMMRFNKSGNIE